MPDINLFHKNETNQSGETTISASHEKYLEIFQKVTYNISYSKPFDLPFLSSFTNYNKYTIYFKFRSRNPYTYYVKNEDHLLHGVEVYFSKLKKDIPLIIGLKTGSNSYFKYYTFIYLRDKSYTTGVPNGGFLEKHLGEKLRQENDKRNKLKFVTKAGLSQNYDAIPDSFTVPGFIRYEYKPKDDDKYEEHRVSTERLLSREELSDKTIINKLFDSINGNMFYFINVYYNINKNVTLLIEFVSESTKIHFERKDDEGYYWEKKYLSYNHEIDTNPNLRNIETQIENSVSYDLERDGGNYMKGKIIVSSEKKGTNKYTVYKHSIEPNEISNLKKTHILYANKGIEIVKNDRIQPPEKLENLTNQIFKEIKAFALNNGLNEHLLINLKKDNTVNYYFRRFNKNGTRWRQVTTEDLENLGIQANRQNVEQILSETNNSSNIKTFLEHIRFEINSICILLDYKSLYNKSLIQQVVGTGSKENYAPPIDIERSTISVKDDTNSNGRCLKSKGYKVYKHILNDAGSAGKVKAINNELYLRFYVDNSQIKLYKTQDASGPQTYIKYQNNKNDLYVYFDGETSTRVLLLCYNDKAYKAKNKDTYKTKWIPITNIKACVCQGASESYYNNMILLRALDNSKLPNVFHLYDKSGSANDYKYSELFHSYLRNQPESAKASDIEVYRKKDGKKLILKPSGEYLSKAAKISEVYFNKYNESNSPLILLISFRDATERLYYSLSQFEDDLVNQFKSIDQLTRFEEAKFLDALISENDKSKDFLTFNIEETYNNDVGATNKYNSNNIQIAEDSNSVPSLLGKGFKRYKHTPVRQSYTKKACVMYKNNVLLHWNDNHSKSGSINDFQGQVLKSVTVYFSNKTDKVPLLVGFEINKGSVEWKYYYHKKYNAGLYWKLLDQSSSLNLLGESISDTNIKKQLIENQEKIVKLLQKVEFSVLNTVVLLIEKRSPYIKRDIQSAISSVNPNITFKPELTIVQPNNIHVTPNNSCDIVKRKGFCIYEHQIDFVKSSSSLKENDKIEIRVLFPTSSRNKYSEIKLYNDKGSDNEKNREYLIYTKTGNRTILYVFFYGSDPRPLLLCYNGNGFIARDKKSYDSYEWIKIVSGTCPCQLNGQNKELLGSLINCVLFLNKVQLEKKENEGTYVVHKFNGKEIKVKIESSVDLPLNSCYKKLIHHPNESGYRLGEIIHTRDANKLTYSSQAPLLSVGVYYNKYDNSYEEPLLIELELSKDIPKTGTLKEFYKYCFDATGTLRWKIERDNNLVTSNISRYLDNIRFGFKKFVKVEIQHNKHISSYQLQVKQSKGPGTFTQLNGDTNINVTQESCEKLKEAKYTCFKHQLTSLKGSTQHQIGGLKITIPKQLPIESSPESVSDQEVSLYKIKENKEYEVLQKIKGQKKEKNKEEEKDTDQNYLYKEVQPYLNPYEPIGYSSCMGDFYVYFHCNNGENKGPIIDPRPGLVCFFNRAYRPLKLPEKKNNGKYNYDLDDYNKWISVEDIKKCGCGEQEKLIAILNEVYDIETPNIALIAGSSAGSIAGVASIGGIGFMIFKKVASVAVTTATAATVSM